MKRAKKARLADELLDVDVGVVGEREQTLDVPVSSDESRVSDQNSQTLKAYIIKAGWEEDLGREMRRNRGVFRASPSRRRGPGACTGRAC